MTPFLALAVSLIYMLKADGEIDDHESSQLQAVVGDHAELLEIAMRYVDETSVEDFLFDCKDILYFDDALCILVNLCDCLLSDGVIEDHELELFRLMSDTFGISQTVFHSHFNHLKLKNDKEVLGVFDPKSLLKSQPSAYLTLACCLLYMMAADGNIADEEIGQLQVVIGEYDGLQAAAMKIVRTVKMNVFLKQACPSLTQEQTLFVLSNVCDSMMSDGKIDVVEENLFQNMMAAFGLSMPAFKGIYETMQIKNIKPFDTSTLPGSIHSRVGADKAHSCTGTFKVRHHKNTDNSSIESGTNSRATDNGEWISTIEQKDLSAVVARTMQDNIKQSHESFASQSDVDSVQNNAVSQAEPDAIILLEKMDAKLQRIPSQTLSTNIQRVDENSIATKNLNVAVEKKLENIQQIEDTTGMSNRQKTASDSLTANIQQIDVNSESANRLKTAADRVTANIQPIGMPTHKVNLQKSGLDTIGSNKQSVGTENVVDRTVETDSAPLKLNSAVVFSAAVTNSEDLLAVHTEHPKLKLIDTQDAANLQAKIDTLHSKLDKLSPNKRNVFPIATLIRSLTERVVQPKAGLDRRLTDEDLESDFVGQVNVMSDTMTSAITDMALVDSNYPIEDTNVELTTEYISENHTTQAVALPNSFFTLRYKRLYAVAIMAICMPLGILAKGLIYPVQTCSGTGHQQRIWVTDKGDSVLLHESSQASVHSIRFNQTQLWVDGMRFPYYMELTQKSNFAQLTPTVIKGGYFDQALVKTRYTFEYDLKSQQLRIDIQSISSDEIKDGNGNTEEDSSFLGQCANDWF